MRVVLSKNGIKIRLSKERWVHIALNHDELTGKVESVLNVVTEPDIIVRGEQNELLAAKRIGKTWLTMVYKETNNTDGFITTAFITSRISYLLNKETVWKK